jgi:hypothetical protein
LLNRNNKKGIPGILSKDALNLQKDTEFSKGYPLTPPAGMHFFLYIVIILPAFWQALSLPAGMHFFLN